MIAAPNDVVPGQVILLNGVSSSGKTSLARQLLCDLDRPFFHIGVDMIGAMRSEPQTDRLDQAALQQALYRTRAGFHRAVAGMALAGNDIVMDHVFSEPWRLQDCLVVMTGIDVVLVGVHCSADELLRREKQRGDRTVGTAAAQLASTHIHGIYDCEIDTSAQSLTDCSAEIRRCARGPVAARAFGRLRGEL
ncbi:chloramphenicol phosphotransferase CPT family protein [Nocardia sp. NPDC088792]|uniref:chloramphenicol phosphotransferase CPT family protein n=1 Tax=Nocardia sp. NPDC088792 TaxID=3364332 RepID=UPI003827C4A9